MGILDLISARLKGPLRGKVLCKVCGTRENDWVLFILALIAVFNGGFGIWMLLVWMG